MQDDTDLDYERYKDWDFSQARPARHNPIIKKIQDNARKAKQDDMMRIIGRLDDDVIQILREHDNDADYKRINAVLKAMFVT